MGISGGLRGRLRCIVSHSVSSSSSSVYYAHVYNTQEEWLSPTERASVSAISLRHILASPGYAPGTIAVNVMMKRGFNACQTHRRMYPSIFNRYSVIQPVSSKVRHFSTFVCTFWPPWVRPWDNRGKCYMDVKRIQCLSDALQHVPIYLQPFPSTSTRKFKSSPF